MIFKAKNQVDGKVAFIGTANDGDKGVDVTVEYDGDTQYIFRINADGTFHRYPYVSGELGLKLDEDGRIVEDDDHDE